MNGNNLFFVSVIVPAYNAEETIEDCIKSLLSQTYPNDRYEIIVVDNNSSDRTKEIVKKHPVKLLEEKNIQSSYAARNKGIRNAKGEILAFIDSDCVARSQWIKEGVKVLAFESADLSGGKVEFTYSEHKSAAELRDSITNMQIGLSIKEKNVAKTANLFVKSLLFGKIGMFLDRAVSGGDVEWTGRATRNGFLLVYAPKAVVEHPARFLKPLIKKQYRVGKGRIYVWSGEGKSPFWITCLVIHLFLPPRFSTVKKLIYQNGTPEMNKKAFGIWGVSYLCYLATGLGVITSFFGILRKAIKNDFK